MYSDKENVLQLAALLKAHGIRQVVLCPGSRNSPITHSLAADSFFTCHSVVDERSAGFYGLGIILKTSEPVAVCCTSGSAVLNLSPAVSEAFYQQLPLLVITADRPESWLGQMDGQTVPQRGVYGGLVKKAVQLPEISTREDAWHCNRLINEAILELNHRGQGPVHINVPISEPLFNYTVPDLPTPRVISRSVATGGGIGARLDAEGFGKRFAAAGKRMIIVGQMPYDGRFCEALREFSAKHACVILAEHLSNADLSNDSFNFDAVLYTLSKDDAVQYAPDLLITMGGHVVSKRIKQLLRIHGVKEHWHVAPSGEVCDLYQQVSHVIEAEPLGVASYLSSLAASQNAAQSGYEFLWKDASRRLPVPNPPYSDLSAVKGLMERLPDSVSLHLSNSSTVRLAQLFPLPHGGVRVQSNRGTNGIEGCLSTAVGHSAVDDEKNYLIIGDLAFFYDMNGIWNSRLKGNLRVLLNNNGGGEIFHALPGLNESGALDSYIAASHKTDAKAWAESRGFAYLSASNEDELQRALPLLMDADSEQPIMLEVFSSMDENAAILRDYYHQLRTR